MAEIGLIASVVGIAGAGLKLSITLYTFSETVATATSDIKNIARDVSLTSAVLEELGRNLKGTFHSPCPRTTASEEMGTRDESLQRSSRN